MTAKIAVIKATLKYSSQEDMIKGMAPLISPGGLFIRTKTTRPTGSEVHFEFQLADGSITYTGEGIVKKEIPYVAGESAKKAGMLISLKRINKPFKTVVDAILSAQETPQKTENRPARQIVESRIDSTNKFSFFDDVDLDSDLDSLFADITKSSASRRAVPVKTKTDFSEFSDMPSTDDLFLEYDDKVEGESFDDTAKPFPAHQESIHGILGTVPQSELKKRSATKTGEFHEEAHEVLEAERQKNRISSLTHLTEGLERRISPAITQTRMTAITGQYTATEELARLERERASQQAISQSVSTPFSDLPVRTGSTQTLQGCGFKSESQTNFEPPDVVTTLQGYTLNPDELEKLRACAHIRSDILPQVDPSQELSEDYHLDDPMPEPEPESDEPKSEPLADSFNTESGTSEQKTETEYSEQKTETGCSEQASDNDNSEVDPYASELDDMMSSDLPGISIGDELFENTFSLDNPDDNETTMRRHVSPEYLESINAQNDKLHLYNEDVKESSNECSVEELFKSSETDVDSSLPDIADQIENLFEGSQDSEEEPKRPSRERSRTFDSLFPSHEDSPANLFEALRGDNLRDDEFENALTTEFVKLDKG